MERACRIYAKSAICIVMLAAVFELSAFILNIPLIELYLKEKISPFKLIAFLLLGSAFFLQNKDNFTRRILTEICTLSTIFIGFILLIIKIYGYIENPSLAMKHIAYPTAGNMIVVGCGVLLMNASRLYMIGQAFLLTGFFIGFTVAMGFLQGLYHFQFISDTPYTTFILSIAWMLLSSAFLLKAPYSGLISVIFSSSLGGRLLRRLLPIVILIPILFSWFIAIGKVSLHMDIRLDSELFGFFTLISFVLVTWGLSYWLAKTDNDRIRGKKLLDTLFIILGKLERFFPLEDPLAPEVLKAITETLEADSGELWIYKPETDSLQCAMVWPESDTEWEGMCKMMQFKPGVGIPGHVFMQRQMINIAEAPLEPFYTQREMAKKRNIQNVIGFPLLSENECSGVIMINKAGSVPFSTDIVSLTPTVGLIIGHYMSLKKTQDARIYLAAIVEASDDAFFRQDSSGLILSWNKGAERVFGYTRGEVIGKNISLLFPASQQKDLKWIFDKLHRGESILDFETETVRKNKHLFDASLTISPIFDQYKSVLGGSVCLRDITQLKQYARMLEAREKQLEEKTQQLQESNKELEQFTTIVSHDLQEPLRKIKNFGQLVQEKKSELSPEVSDYVSHMVGGAERMTRLITSLLELSRANKKELKKERIRLDDVLANVIAELNFKIHETGAQISIEKLPEVEADPAQMFRLFLNLISNAINYHKPNVPPIIVVQGEISEGLARITIQDNGIGIPSKFKEKIFSPFFRMEGIKKLPGTGIGLSICKKIVERHNGHIYAESSEGLGTLIVIGLPIFQKSEEVNL